MRRKRGSSSMSLHIEHLREAIESIRRPPHCPLGCPTCADQWDTAMKALLVALEVGAEGAEMDEAGIFYGEFTHLVEVEWARGYAPD